MQDKTEPELQLDGSLWRFALAFYGTPGVSQACLKLQDEAEVDVVVLIGILYAYTVLGQSMDAAAISALRDVVTPWREATVLPIRRLRRDLKRPPEGFPAAETEMLRNLIKQAELKAEQIQLALIERRLVSLAGQAGLPLEDALARLSAAAAQTRVLFDLLISAARAAGSREA